MTRLTATYRLQLAPGFTLHNAARQVPYLRDLGISHLYLSPILEARSGSAHGYDVTDPGRIRAELGGEAGFESLATAARNAGMSIVLDIVPNHMAASSENPWWRDVLEFGIDSPHARAFDLGWRSDGNQTRLLVPVLGDDRMAVLARGDIALGLDERGLVLRHGERFFPISPATYGPVLRALGCARAARTFDALPPPPPLNGMPRPERRARALAVRDGWLVELGNFADNVHDALAAWNELPPRARAAVLLPLVERQPYELAFWRRGSRELTYRRFFDVTDLAGVRVEDGDVFRATHARILDLVGRGDIDGLRIDHVDGLRDPAQYLGRLAQAHRGRPLLLVEKIVAPDEDLPASWPVAGTTGYEFANAVGGWFIDADGWRALRRAYIRFTDCDSPFEELAFTRQRQIIDTLFGGELRVLVRALVDLAARTAPAFDAVCLAAALADVSACLGVYRTYITGWPVASTDRARVQLAVAEAARRAPGSSPALLDWLRSVLLLELPTPERAAALDFILHWQQFTGPVMAKGFEDTALYNDFTLAAANEVGGRPASPFVDVDQLHAFLARRAQRAPSALSATSTHDTKRSEDVRLRIAALTRHPAEWIGILEQSMCDDTTLDPSVPSPADRVLLYQTLIGLWPSDPRDERARQRIRAYLTKAAREAKVRTSWRDPDTAYETALGHAVDRALDPTSRLCQMLDALARRVAQPAALASLAQTTIKVTAPGVPDFYQGSERWHLALVDPDNRAPVDYGAAAHAWATVEPLLAAAGPDEVAALLHGWRDGRIKQFITAAALRHRAASPHLYSDGDYQPLPVSGGGAADVLAYARTRASERALTVVRRWSDSAATGNNGRERCAIEIPAGWPEEWMDVFTRRVHRTAQGELAVDAVLDLLPCALLVPALP